MSLNSNRCFAILKTLRQKKPLVLNLTNSVVTEFSANVLLALGASPLMTNEPRELNELLKISEALVINIGTINQHQIDCMKLAINMANTLTLPIVIDPVGAGASQIRTDTAIDFIRMANHCIVKGNPAEIAALNNIKIESKGVDSKITLSQPLEIGKKLLRDLKIDTLIITGAEDLIMSHDQALWNSRGAPLMSQVTGTGCALGGVLAAFLATHKNSFEACVSAVEFYGTCGESVLSLSAGPGSFKSHFLDTIASA